MSGSADQTPKKFSCLLVVDVQKKFHDVVKDEFPNFSKNIEKLLVAARAQENLKIIHIRAEYTRENSKWMEFWDELVLPSKKGTTGQIFPSNVSEFALDIEGEPVIAKSSFDGFYNTNLEEQLREWNVEHLYVCGLITSCCVLFTTFSAFTRGFKITLIDDCCADRTVEKHNHTIDVYGRYMFYSRKLEEVFTNENTEQQTK